MLRFNFRSGKKEKSAKEYRECAAMHMNAVKSSMGTFLQTGVVIVATVVVMVALGRAWFVSNSQVSSGAATVNAQQDVIRIASKGVRQIAETSSKLNLPEGTEYEYNNEKYYYTEDCEIALYLTENYSVFPGASGSIEFYIIPTSDASRTVTLYLGLAGYKMDDTDTAVSAQDEVLDALLKGHILLFNQKDDMGWYSGWSNFSDSNGIIQNTITIDLPENSNGKPYLQTIYWIWPKRYENLVSHRPGKGDLFAEDSTEFDEEFLPFVETQSSAIGKPFIGETNYIYSNLFVSKDWESSLDYDQRKKAYNLADEYIGTNADYLYLTIRTSPVE